MRKGYRSANARPLFFEKELFYCKLTVTSDIQKGLLLVSFVAVGNYCRGMLKNAFLYRVALHEPKKRLYRESKNSLAETLRTSLKATFLRTKTSFARAFLRCPQKLPFYVQKAFLSYKPFLLPPKATLFHPPPPIPTDLNLLSAKNSHFHKPKAFFRTNLSLLLSKTALFHPPPPIPTPLNLLSTKEYSCSFNLCSNSLRSKA